MSFPGLETIRPDGIFLLSKRRAHRERLRDRPCETAATDTNGANA